MKQDKTYVINKAIPLANGKEIAKGKQAYMEQRLHILYQVRAIPTPIIQVKNY